MNGIASLQAPSSWDKDIKHPAGLPLNTRSVYFTKARGDFRNKDGYDYLLFDVLAAFQIYKQEQLVF
jgi:hypothetical protein